MKKLHSLLFYALLTPAITLGSGAVLAAQGSSENTDMGEQSMGHDAAPAMQGPEHDKNVTKSRYNTDELADEKMGDPSRVQNKDYMNSLPTNGLVASDLIGAELKTSDDQSVGEIGDLIIDQDGRVAAVVVNAGGYLGMGEKHVAIGWNAVKISGNPDNPDLRVDMTADDLQSAPSYEKSPD
ncbi:PRC-barrel domain-containing protein [Marinobacter orientalis]|uniref:PRC-barrel domain-containing protein n=1 Tax=Marinobacter orientalis TaxID=1928859 RepID=A0A7Y0RDS0_9GAMM|nr:PRC-barrel domain-containing protein [Marinobacter orientalis]NMT64366.1 PRC-barrel domain-containing protein [Marinobacter orientalis]